MSSVGGVEINLARPEDFNIVPSAEMGVSGTVILFILLMSSVGGVEINLAARPEDFNIVPSAEMGGL